MRLSNGGFCEDLCIQGHALSKDVNVTFHLFPILVILLGWNSVIELKRKLFSVTNEFLKNRRYESPTLFKGRHEFISVFSTFIAVSEEMQY